MPIEHSYGDPNKQNILPPKSEKTRDDFRQGTEDRANQRKLDDDVIAEHVRKHKRVDKKSRKAH